VVGHFCLVSRTNLSYSLMTGNELIKRLRRIGRICGLSVWIDKKRGCGSHFTLYFGGRYTIMKDRSKESGPGLLKKILGNLGLSKKDLE